MYFLRSRIEVIKRPFSDWPSGAATRVRTARKHEPIARLDPNDRHDEQFVCRERPTRLRRVVGHSKKREKRSSSANARLAYPIKQKCREKNTHHQWRPNAHAGGFRPFLHLTMVGAGRIEQQQRVARWRRIDDHEAPVRPHHLARKGLEDGQLFGRRGDCQLLAQQRKLPLRGVALHGRPRTYTDPLPPHLFPFKSMKSTLKLGTVTCNVSAMCCAR